MINKLNNQKNRILNYNNKHYMKKFLCFYNSTFIMIIHFIKQKFSFNVFRQEVEIVGKWTDFANKPFKNLLKIEFDEISMFFFKIISINFFLI